MPKKIPARKGQNHYVMENVTIREYREQDQPMVLDLLRLNTPDNFSPEEAPGLVHYLNHEIEHYFVVEVDGIIAGSGGFNFWKDGEEGVLSWDIFHPAYQRRNLGSRLVQYRLAKLKTYPMLRSIVVRTSQMSWKFYEKQGFQLLEVKENFWAPGFDMYSMVYIGGKG